MLDSVLLWIEKSRPRFLRDLKTWLAIPSVSAQKDHDTDTRQAAQWAMDSLRGIGLDTKLIETPRHPCILATTPNELAEPGAPHVLFYGHYDVQPAEPLDLWTTPAFTPTVRQEKLFARGACDDKGQVHCHLAALLAWKEINTRLPVRLTVLLEGEEEIGSPNLMGVVNANKELLRSAKTLIISDSNQFAPGVPAITYGLRGLVYFEIKIKGAKSDLHSGLYGGAVANPANALCQILGNLHDAGGRVTIPGFYDQVEPLKNSEKDEWNKLPFDVGALARELGVTELWGEEGYSTLARKWARPTLDINGLTSGYQGPGAKTVLPCEASAKVSCRLVPHQDAAEIANAFEKHIHALTPPGVTCEILRHGAGSAPAITPTDSPAIQAAREALEIGFGKTPVMIREGGSIPVVTWLKDALGVDAVMMGFGLPDDGIHAPNEKMNLDCYYGGIKAAAALYDALGKKLN